MVNYEESKTCCFFGHRKINKTLDLKNHVVREIEKLILNFDVYIFLFGSRSEFEDLCYDVLTILKNKYPNIIRVYVRAEYNDISKEYEEGLLKGFDYTYFPEKLLPNHFVYIRRNQEMINKSKFCICYYNDKYYPTVSYANICNGRLRNSGTSIAYKYAESKHKTIINLYNSQNNN